MCSSGVAAPVSVMVGVLAVGFLGVVASFLGAIFNADVPVIPSHAASSPATRNGVVVTTQPQKTVLLENSPRRLSAGTGSSA
jgi:hypothetical protein